MDALYRQNFKTALSLFFGSFTDLCRLVQIPDTYRCVCMLAAVMHCRNKVISIFRTVIKVE